MTVATKPAAAGATELAASGALGKVGHYRWTICALLFFATTINYIDRKCSGFSGRRFPAT
jgi:ACS family hexuronate transporter-like MFS transporter